jgi:hypothetical protein
MKRFRYGGDALCICACAAYAANTWLIPEAWRGAFLRDHFNDVLLIPAALPLVLWLQRRLGLRMNDDPPRWVEVALAVGLWSIAAEIVAPLLFAGSTADWRDAVAKGRAAHEHGRKPATRRPTVCVCVRVRAVRKS